MPESNAMSLHGAELHHKRFDSHSGRVSVAKPAPAKRINDVVRAKAHSLVVTPRPTVSRPSTPIIPSYRVTGVMDVQRAPAPSHKPHKPERAKTLMRTAVKRPAASLKRRAKAQTRTDILVKSPKVSVKTKQSSLIVDQQRKLRAEQIDKSQLIRHFAPEQNTWFRQNSASKAAQAAAVPMPTPPSRSAAAPTNRSMDIFQRALTHATAHEQPPVEPARAEVHRTVHPAAKAPRRARRPIHHHLVSTVAASLAVVLLFGFFAYQNKADITMRFANAKAGFHATLPGYKPSGFAAGNFRYSPGVVSVEYARAGTSRTYTISQQVSKLNNQTLLDTTITPNSKSYQTFQQGNRTIYLYGNSNAAWVDNGVLYKITSNGNLTSNDILDIATSV